MMVIGFGVAVKAADIRRERAVENQPETGLPGLFVPLAKLGAAPGPGKDRAA